MPQSNQPSDALLPEDFSLVHPARSGTRRLTAEAVWALPRVGGAVPLPCGTKAVVRVTRHDAETNRGRARLHLVDLRAEGEHPRPLTREGESASSPAVSPDGSRLAYLRRPAAGEPRQVHVLPLDGGESAAACDLPLGALDVAWMPAGDALIVAAPLFRGHLTPEATAAERERREELHELAHVTEDAVFRFWDRWLTDGRVVHVFHVDLASGRMRDLTPRAEHWFAWMDPTGHVDVHPDGHRLAYGSIAWDEGVRRLRSTVRIVDVESGATQTVDFGDVHSAARPRWSADGTALVCGTTRDPDFYADTTRLLARRDDGSVTELAPGWALSADDWRAAPGGGWWIRAAQRARRALFRLMPDETRPREVVGDGSVSSARPLPSGGAVYTRSTLSHPAEVFVVDDAGTSRRVTDFADHAMEGVALGAVLETTCIGAEGRPVQLFVALPPGVPGDPPAESASRPPPLVQVVHGGPHGMSADSFHPRWNGHLFAAPGYVAAMVNFQGSSSFGQEFAQCIQGTWGDRPYRDVMAATDLLVERGLCDGERMAAAGGSYGGYLVSWIAAHTHRFRCIVNHAGVFDTQGMFASDVIQARHVSLGGRPWDDAEGLDRWNPLRHAASIETPTLVLHGARDYRVPLTQGLLCYSVLKNRGVPARLVVFPKENHWVLSRANALLWYREVEGWLARWLGDDAERDEA